MTLNELKRKLKLSKNGNPVYSLTFDQAEAVKEEIYNLENPPKEKQEEKPEDE